MNKKILIGFVLLITSCASIDSVQNQFYVGMSKNAACDLTLNKVLLTQNPCYAHINYLYKIPNSYYQYNKEMKTEVLGADGKYLVFKNVKYKVNYPEYPPKNGGILILKTTNFNTAMSIARTGGRTSNQTVTERRLAEEKRNKLEAEKKQRENEALEKKYKRDDDGFQTQDQLDKDEKQLIEEREKLRKEQLEIIEAKRKQKEIETAKQERNRVAEQNRKDKEEEEQLRKDQKEIISTVQALLYALGYSPGDEGEYDFRTQTAIKAYQSDTDMKPIDGEISEALLIKLQSSFSKKQNTLDLKNYSVVGTGSGYLVDKNGHVVTNEHVVNGCSVITTGKNNTAELLRADATNDIAIIKTSDTEKYKAMSFAGKDPALGQRIFVSGFPLNQILENLNFTSGTVSSEVGLMQNINQFQFTAPIQPGNSGGPILNEYGGVLGMSVATVSNKKFEEMLDTLVQNINFGIRQSSVQSLLDQEGINYETGNPNWLRNEESVAKEAKAGTVLIKCWNLN